MLTTGDPHPNGQSHHPSYTTAVGDDLLLESNQRPSAAFLTEPYTFPPVWQGNHGGGGDGGLEDGALVLSPTLLSAMHRTMGSCICYPSSGGPIPASSHQTQDAGVRPLERQCHMVDVPSLFFLRKARERLRWTPSLGSKATEEESAAVTHTTIDGEVLRGSVPEADVGWTLQWASKTYTSSFTKLIGRFAAKLWKRWTTRKLEENTVTSVVKVPAHNPFDTACELLRCQSPQSGDVWVMSEDAHVACGENGEAHKEWHHVATGAVLRYNPTTSTWKCGNIRLHPLECPEEKRFTVHRGACQVSRTASSEDSGGLFGRGSPMLAADSTESGTVSSVPQTASFSSQSLLNALSYGVGPSLSSSTPTCQSGSLPMLVLANAAASPRHDDASCEQETSTNATATGFLPDLLLSCSFTPTNQTHVMVTVPSPTLEEGRTMPVASSFSSAPAIPSSSAAARKERYRPPPLCMPPPASLECECPAVFASRADLNHSSPASSDGRTPSETQTPHHWRTTGGYYVEPQQPVRCTPKSLAAAISSASHGRQ